MADSERLPVHVGIIMDGNGRWAKQRLRPRSYGHDAGMKRVMKLATHARERGIKYLTLYTLSTENLNRPQEELEGIYNLFRRYFGEYASKLAKDNIKVRIIGDISVLPPDVQEKMLQACSHKADNPDLTLIFAINYSSRAEIVRAANMAVERGGKVTEESFSRLLYTGDLPDPDLIIRTGREVRLSNFLLWQAAYAELYFTDILFPDFNNAAFDKALKDFSLRDRRYGKI
ncbi:MAG: di-trans,poly-cis-decaprenylcistransferase [Clostridia bacterium]|nr:di-trans,poly-cis-decaprenylcistransferase [Clostridia bacterium]